jgi:chromosome segregation protein
MFTLDRMEVHGFKSFYGRTQFEFRHGITAVVGPNGCGKSNIGDAISWVLGDQSPKSLRAERMADVIFNGSEARKPLGMAEVTLRFLGPNGGPEKPEEFLVSRRLYRSGESEYLLNGSRCRLKDIQETLSRSNVGSRLYSVIEQGKVDLILASKPKDRRGLFEEAAGILAYKAKRRVALGKLEATQANLLRIHDILSEVQKQAGSLRRQVARARRYQRLQDAIRSRRGVLLRTRLNDLDLEEGRGTAARRELADREAEASARLSRSESQVESLRRRFEETELEARAGRDRLNDLDREMDRNRLLLQQAGEQREEARRAIARWAGEVEGIRGKLADRAARLRDRRAAIEGSRNAGRALEAELNGKEEEQRRRVDSLGSAERASEDCRAALLTALDRLAEARGLADRLEQAVRSHTERSRTLLQEIESSRQDLEKRRVELDEAAVLGAALGSEAERLWGAREGAEEALAQEDKSLAGIAARREELAATTAQIEERRRALEEDPGGSAGSERGIAAVLTGAREGRLRIQGRVSDALDVEPAWTAAAEAALKEILRAVVVEAPAEALRAVEFLREGSGGRCAFLAVGESPREPADLPAELASHPRCAGRLLEKIRSASLERSLRVLLEKTVLVSDLESALDLATRHPEWTFVTREGDLLQAGGLIQGGAPESEQEGILLRRRSREEQGRLMEAARKERDRLESEQEERAAARKAILDRIATLEEKIRDKEREKMEAALRLDQRQEEAARVRRTLDLAEVERQRLETETEDLVSERQRVTATLSEAESQRADLETQIAEAARRVAEARAETATGGDLLASFRSRVAVEQEKIRAGDEEIAAAEREVAEEEERMRRAEREGQAASEQVRNLESAAAGLEESLRGGQAARTEAAARLEGLEKDLAAVRSGLLSAEQAEKIDRSLVGEVKAKISEADVAAARIAVELKHLESSCLEELAMDLTGVRGLPLPEQEISSARLEQEVAEIKARLETLGAVNLAALEQFREMEERHTFLAKQKKDLEDSIESLHDTIRKINRTSREKFLEAFERIQEGFNQTFHTLFGGGKAELRLMEDEDVLECGIEITASPPGKRLQSITLLSGGEKAMTAVALLFALFRYRPSPFCVLDEVDAPLDEANVGRFTRMLRDLTPETQFIVITHNRRSMEAADLLYGITMEEPGISKVVSMRLEN